MISPAPSASSAPNPATRESGRATFGTALLGLVLLAAAGYRWSIAHVGLDFSDESYALLAARHPMETTASSTLFFYYTAPLSTLTNGDIAGLRQIGLVLFLAASAALAAGASAWLRASASSLFVVVGLGGLSYYSRGVSVPNYNHLTSAGLTTGFGLLLLALARPDATRPLALIGAGFALAVAAAAKPPVALALVFAAFLVATRTPARRGLAWLATGAFAALVIPLAFHSPAEIALIVRRGVRFTLLSGTGHGAGESLVRYAVQLAPLLGRTAAYAVLPLLVGFAGRTRWSSPRRFPIELVVLLAVLAFDDALFGGRSAARSGRTTAAILAAMIVCAGPNRALFHRLAREDRWPVAVGALLIPPLALLGTNTNVASALVLFIAPWFLLVPLCLADSAAGPGERLVRGAVPALLAAFASTTAPHTSAYGLTAPFAEQTVRLTLGEPATTILTDRQTARFIGRLQTAASECGLRPGQDVIGLLEMPGFIFALGGVSPASAFYPPDGAGLKDAVSFVLSTLPDERLHRSFVLVNDHALRLGTFAIAGRRVPDDYDVCLDRDGPSKYGDMRVRLLRPRPIS